MVGRGGLVHRPSRPSAHRHTWLMVVVDAPGLCNRPGATTIHSTLVCGFNLTASGLPRPSDKGSGSGMHLATTFCLVWICLLLLAIAATRLRLRSGRGCCARSGCQVAEATLASSQHRKLSRKWLRTAYLAATPADALVHPPVPFSTLAPGPLAGLSENRMYFRLHLSSPELTE